MNILITGGAGYIGSVITQALMRDGHDTKIIDLLWFKRDIPLLYSSSHKCKFIRGDINDTKLLEDILKKGIDYVVHTAAVVGDPASKKFPELTRKVNYDGSLKLIAKCEEYRVKGFIFFSTCSNYGISDGLATENSALKPLSLYAETKVKVERHLMDNIKGLDWVICRLSTAYGLSPRMRFDLTVNDFAMNAYFKKYLGIFLPYTYRPYVHVSDIANVIGELIKNFDKVKNNVFNLGFEGENYQKIKIAEIAKEFMPDTQLEISNNGADSRDYQVDFSKLKRFLDIKNKYRVMDGIGSVIEVLKSGIITDPYDKIYNNSYPEFWEGGKT